MIPHVGDELLDGVGHCPGVSSQHRPLGGIFRVDGQRASRLYEASRTLQHSSCSGDDGLHGCMALLTVSTKQVYNYLSNCLKSVISEGVQVSARYKTNLRADLGWNTGKLWVGGKSSEVFHSFNERTSGSSALLSVFLVERSIQSLKNTNNSIIISHQIFE